MVTKSGFFNSFDCTSSDGRTIGCYYGSKQVNCRVPALGKKSVPVITEVVGWVAGGGHEAVTFEDVPSLKKKNVKGKTHNYVCGILGKEIAKEKWKGPSVKI